MKKSNLNKSKMSKSLRSREVKLTVPKPIGFPDTIKTRLKYSDVLTISGAAQQYTFRANSLFDPDLTSTGHQPMYYDQYIAVYEKYRVHATTIRIRAVTKADPFQIVIMPSSTVPTITSAAQALETPRAVASDIITQFEPVTFQTTMKTETILGLRGGQIWDTDFSGLFNTNPSDLWYFSLYLNPLINNLSCVLEIELVFHCEFYDRQPIAIS